MVGLEINSERSVMEKSSCRPVNGDENDESINLNFITAQPEYNQRFIFVINGAQPSVTAVHA